MSGTPYPSAGLVAVLDIGKSNAKLSLVERSSGQTIHRAERCTSTADAQPIPQLDVGTIESWLTESLAAAPNRDRIDSIVPVAHGATAALVSSTDEVLAVPDYEAEAFERFAEDYRPQRDSFELTYSPWLPRGLNLGRQLYHYQRQNPSLHARVSTILPYPQFWAWRLCAVAASELTSLGCHTDLWRPARRSYSALAQRHGWSSLLPSLRRADEVLGRITPGFARATGLDAQCRVLCGIHDSNASYLHQVATRPAATPVAIVSSGTWTVVMARGADLTRLREDEDMLANVDAHGECVATARFMGGREYKVIAGSDYDLEAPTMRALADVVRKGAMALPSLVTASGGFTDGAGRLIGAEQLDVTQRAALATLYCALMVDRLLDLLAMRGADVVIDGPLAGNPLFAAVLAALRPHASVFVSSQTGTRFAAGSVLAGISPDPNATTAVPAADFAGLDAYRQTWKERIA